MEGSSKSVSQQYQVRSISLPSRLHSSPLKIETELNKLKISISSTSSTSSDTIQKSLVGLAELYSCFEELIHSQNTQQAIHQHQNRVLVEEALEGSIGLLDSCATLKDLITLMKENMQEIQSALRRKGGDLSIERHISAYFCSRKQAKKTIAKSLRALKQTENKTRSPLPLNVDPHLAMVVRVLREVSVFTISVYRSFLLFLSVKSKPVGLISNLMIKSLKASERDQGNVNEVESVDLALSTLRRKFDVHMTHDSFQKLDDRIQYFEAGLDCLYRRLIQSRASLLNVLTN